IRQIVNYLVLQQDDPIYATYQLQEEIPTDGEIQSGGMLSSCISLAPALFVLWFRAPVQQNVNWGGNPEKAVLVSKEESGVRLSPRKSFAKWQMQIKDQSLRWQEYDLQMAGRIRDHLVRQALRRTTREVQELNTRLAAIINKEFEQLIYIASHDLQEPLRTIRNYNQLLQDFWENKQEELPPEFLFQRMSRSIERMQTLIKDLLDYSRIGRSAKIEPIDLNTVISGIREDLEEVIQQTQTTLIVPALPTIKGNVTELKSLFQNLITNAIKYRHPDRNPEIEITVRQEAKNWVFSLTDNGIGIAEEHHERIFLMFQRLHPRREYEGTGIGLANAKKIVESYNGEIWLESELNRGTTFHFSLHEDSTLFFS
ncbi:MAG: ATP-binding protein, partial [Bacteroidota bacterium]